MLFYSHVYCLSSQVLKVIGKKMTRKALAMIKALADAEKKGDKDDEDEEGVVKDDDEVDEEEAVREHLSRD